MLQNEYDTTHINFHPTEMALFKIESPDLDPSLYCVSPYEVLQGNLDTQQYSPSSNGDTTLQDDASDTRRNWATSNGGVFYGSPKPKVKLEMEEFQPIPEWATMEVSVKPTTSSSIDELNTPVFEKGPFDYDKFVSPRSVLSPPLDDDFFKHYNISVTSTNNNNNIYNAMQNETIFSDISTDNQNPEKSVNIDQEQNKIVYHTTLVKNEEGNSPPSAYGDIFFVNDDNTIVSTIASAAPSPVYEGNDNGTLGLITPEDSNSSEEESHADVPNLRLNIPASKFSQSVEVDTPGVIESVVGLEDNFNILDVVKDDEMGFINADELFKQVTQQLQAPPAVLSQNNLPTKKLLAIPVKKPRKRKTEDSDEEYLPPSLKTFKSNNKYTIHYDDSSEESETEEIPVKRSKPRGRPPKRTNSISSSCSKDSGNPDGSRYRELRDKNNEASRKSRQKRKMKEMTLEKECEQLNEKNVKLKAQVESLEKMLSNFRDNLFKIMMNKK